MKLLVIGLGYVGLSSAVMFARENEVLGIDIDQSKNELIKKKISPIKDEMISSLLKQNLNLTVSSQIPHNLDDFDFCILALPTNFDEKQNGFNTKKLEEVIDIIYNFNSHLPIIIKSTIPIGFTKRMQTLHQKSLIMFSPEFLREGKALYDSLHPSRVIIGLDLFNREKSEEIVQMYLNLVLMNVKVTPKTDIMSSEEAESVKLFSNAYLAMRVAFFNEIDTFSQVNSLNTRAIVLGVCADPRIGDYYNNPSFGYGGYCLPKDTKQLLSHYNEIPQSLIESIVLSNEIRKKQIVDCVAQMGHKTIGIYRLSMKSQSDNHRGSASLEIALRLADRGIEVIVYEPFVCQNSFSRLRIVNDFRKFKEEAEVILANRYDSCLKDVQDKVYTRDIFGRD